MGSNLVSIEQRKIGRNLYVKGFSLVELMVVISVIAILTAIAVPLFSSFTDKTKKVVCDANCLQLKKMYEVWLISEGREHTKELFFNYRKEYGHEICPDGNDVDYHPDGEVQCIVHSVEEDDGDGSDGGSVPYL